MHFFYFVFCRDLKDEVRIFILLLYGNDIRNFLITCYFEGMLDGSYTFWGPDVGHVKDMAPYYTPEEPLGLIRYINIE